MAAVASGCVADGPENSAAAFAEPSGPAQARVIVTTYFGAHILLDAVVGIDEGTTAMEALASLAETRTAYGGGFVQSINGVGGGASKADWFYYINGLTARTGGMEYTLSDGDVEHWDYHPWSAYEGLSAIMGSFPCAFVNGYGGERRPSLVAYEPEYAGEAADISAFLRAAGATEVSTVSLAQLTREQTASSHLVLLAGPDALAVREMFDKRSRLGISVSLDGGVLRAFAASGDEEAVYEGSAGVLAATQNPWNPKGTGACENVVVVVSGCDEAGVRAAARALTYSPERYLTWCGVVVTPDGDVLPVPVAQG